MATVTAPDTVEVVRHQAGDQEDIFRFYAETFGQDLTEGSRGRWRWQYAENPEREAEGPAIWVAREGDGRARPVRVDAGAAVVGRPRGAARPGAWTSSCARRRAARAWARGSSPPGATTWRSRWAWA